jgi:nitrate reductase gamma subunit
MIDFIHGPLVSIAFIVFFLGLLFQLFQFFRLTRKKEWGRPPLPQSIKPEKKTPGKIIASCLAALSGTLWKTDPVLTIVTSVFHVLLIITPLFLLGHNILLQQAWGWSLFSLPEPLSDGLTVIVLLCGMYFLGRRLFLARVRAITSLYDYVVLLIALAPFLTGFFAYHQWFNYDTVILLHILSGQLMLIAIPFTKLGHMLFFFLYRFFIGGEYSFLRGSRTW